MADELWIVSDAESAGWTVDAEGKVDTNKKYNLESGRISIAVPDAPLTEKQAKAIRKLIGKLRADGVLGYNPKVGVQYPHRTTVDNVTQSMRYLHCWPDDCDIAHATSADAGVSTKSRWIEPVSVEPPDQSVHQDPTAESAEFAATRERRKARNEDALYGRDDPPSEPAAGVTQDQPSKDSLEGDTGGVPNQMVLQEGMEGVEVQAWQGVCNEVLGQTDDHDYVELLIADGVFGPETTTVTAVVQTILLVPATGIVDEDTWIAVL
jgi:peptidoglycan hydrolase-like protein with peptidoglycan-binding domain